MPTNTTTRPDMATTIPAITEEMNRHPEGITVRKLAGAAGLPLSVVTDTLTVLERDGNVTRTPGAGNGNRKGADLWTITPTTRQTDATPDTTDEPATTDEAGTGDTIPDDGNAEATPDDTSDTGPAVLPEAPVSGAPAGNRDLRVIIVAGILGDHPDGVSAANVADESGLRSAIVSRALAAMEAAGAAVRLPADESGVELWTRGEADPATVSLAQAPTQCTCTCGNTHRIRNTVTARRSPTAPGQNSNGTSTLGKNELRTMVRDFLNGHQGHEFNATTIARELGRSSGAVGNALARLSLTGEAVLTSEAPMRYTAAPTADEATATEE